MTPDDTTGNDRRVDPRSTHCSIELHDGTTLAAPTLPELARAWASHVMGPDWSPSTWERAGGNAAMFQELATAFGVPGPNM